jgi:ferredoxin
MPKLLLQPGGKVLEAPRKANLLRFLQDSGIPVGSACGGKGLCASCKLQIISGEKNLSRPNDRELDLAERNRFTKRERISCQTKILGDIEISAPYWSEESLE